MGGIQEQSLCREMLGHSVALWCWFGTKLASGQCRAGYGRSRVNLTVVQCPVMTFISLSITYCCDTSVAWPDNAEVACVPWLSFLFL